MKSLTFKTTIKCSGCIEKVTPVLNALAGEENWKVDLQNPNRLLTITANDELKAETIISALQGVGYKAEEIG